MGEPDLTIQGWEHEQAGELVRAEAVYRMALQAGEPEAAHYLGELLVDSGRPGEALPLLLSDAATDDGSRGFLSVGNALADLGRVEEALAYYQRAADAGVADGLHNLGDLLKTHGRPKEAIEVWRVAVEAGATDPVVFAHLLADEGEYLEAESLFRAAAAQGDIDALTDLGAMQQDRGQLEAAEITLRESVTGGSDEAYVYLASVLRRQGNIEESMRVLQEGASRGIASAELQLGNRLSEQPETASAAEELYQRALAHGEEEARLNLGIHLVDAGDSTEGMRLIAEAASRGDALAQKYLDTSDTRD